MTIFPAYLCKHHKFGLANPQCKLQPIKGTEGYFSCDHKKNNECENWINDKDETVEDVLYRIVHSADHPNNVL